MAVAPFMAASSFGPKSLSALEKPRDDTVRIMSMLLHVGGPLTSSPNSATTVPRTKSRKLCHRCAHVLPLQSGAI